MPPVRMVEKRKRTLRRLAVWDDSLHLVRFGTLEAAVAHGEAIDKVMGTTVEKKESCCAGRCPEVLPVSNDCRSAA